jgi:cytochrome c-type biogenesis protein CcmH/NrfF
MALCDQLTSYLVSNFLPKASATKEAVPATPAEVHHAVTLLDTLRCPQCNSREYSMCMSSYTACVQLASAHWCCGCRVVA